MKSEHKQLAKDTNSREEFVGTLLLEDWEMPRATALRIWSEVTKKPTTKRGRPKKEKKVEVSFSEYQPEKPYIVKDPYFPESEKKQPGHMKWMEFKDMTRFIKDRNKLTRPYLSKFGFSVDEINWLVDNGYVKYGGYEL